MITPKFIKGTHLQSPKHPSGHSPLRKTLSRTDGPVLVEVEGLGLQRSSVIWKELVDWTWQDPGPSLRVSGLGFTQHHSYFRWTLLCPLRSDFCLIAPDNVFTSVEILRLVWPSHLLLRKNTVSGPMDGTDLGFLEGCVVPTLIQL